MVCQHAISKVSTYSLAISFTNQLLLVKSLRAQGLVCMEDFETQPQSPNNRWWMRDSLLMGMTGLSPWLPGEQPWEDRLMETALRKRSFNGAINSTEINQAVTEPVQLNYTGTSKMSKPELEPLMGAELNTHRQVIRGPQRLCLYLWDRKDCGVIYDAAKASHRRTEIWYPLPWSCKSDVKRIHTQSWNFILETTICNFHWIFLITSHLEVQDDSSARILRIHLHCI